MVRRLLGSVLMRGRVSALVVVLGFICSACSATAERPDDRGGGRGSGDDAAFDAGATPTPIADHVEIVRGVADRGRDPAVVAIDIAGESICSGTLISPRLVLTARHCTSRTVSLVSCPATSVQVQSKRSPHTLGILAGEDVASARLVAHGIEVIEPSGVTLCDADIAIIVLDEAVTVAKPLGVRSVGVAVGDYVRAVGFGRPRDRDPAGKKLLREHVRVQSVSSAEFTVGEATCDGDSGGPALDEDTSEVLGVVSRGGPTCVGRGVHNIYTRVDAYSWLIAEAFARVAEIDLEERTDAGASNPASKPAKPGTKQKPVSDVGGPCTAGDDCAAGICIKEGARQYCSRPCGPGDRCPTNYHCKPVSALSGNGTACINVR